MAKARSKKLKVETKEAPTKGLEAEQLIPIDWKIPISFLAGVLLTTLYFTLPTILASTTNNMLSGNASRTDAHVNLVVLTDASCPICDHSWIADRVATDFFNVTVSYVDINSAQGHSYRNALSINTVPAAFFDNSVEEAGNFSTYSTNGWITPVSNYYVLSIQGEKDLTRTPSSTPRIDLFVMGKCPYGTAAETTMKNILNAISGFTFEVHFIGEVYNESQIPPTVLQNIAQYGLVQKNDSKYYSSLHGSSEIDGDIAQLCVMKYYPTNWFNFTLEYNKDFSIANAINTMGYNSTLINNCVNSPEGWDLFADDVKIASGVGVSASPTYLFDNNIIGSSSMMQYGPAGVLCTLHSTLPGCENVDTIQVAQASGSC